MGQTDHITTIDHHISNRKALLSNSNVKIMLQKPWWPRRKKQKWSYHTNDLSFPSSKNHKKYISDYLPNCVYVNKEVTYIYIYETMNELDTKKNWNIQRYYIL